MTSSDLKRFYELYFEKRFQIFNFSVEFDLDTGSKAEVELFKDDKREVIKSDEEDLAHSLLRFQKIVDSDGTKRFARVENSKEYFEAIIEFAEHRETKISKALEDLKTGKSPLEGGFWHNVDKALVKLLFEKTSRDDLDIHWLRANYFHIFAFYLDEVKGFAGLSKNGHIHKHKDSRSLTASAETILRDSFISKQRQRNPVEIYKSYRQYLPDSLEDHSERVSIQLAYLKDLTTMLKKVGSLRRVLEFSMSLMFIVVFMK